MPRTITVLYFAAVRDIAGTSEAHLVLENDVRTIADLAALIQRMHAGLAGRLGSVRYAINESFVTSQTTIADGDVVAVIPPVAGG